MKKNKILAGISALVMGATMMGGTAMSASAYQFTPLTGGTADAGFYYLKDGNYYVAPTKMGVVMYDAMIEDVTDLGGGAYSVDFQTAVSTWSSSITGEVTSIVDPVTNQEMLINDTATLTKDYDYTMTIDVQAFGIHPGGHTMTVQLRIS